MAGRRGWDGVPRDPKFQQMGLEIVSRVGGGSKGVETPVGVALRLALKEHTCTPLVASARGRLSPPAQGVLWLWVASRASPSRASALSLVGLWAFL